MNEETLQARWGMATTRAFLGHVGFLSLLTRSVTFALQGQEDACCHVHVEEAGYRTSWAMKCGIDRSVAC